MQDQRRTRNYDVGIAVLSLIYRWFLKHIWF